MLIIRKAYCLGTRAVAARVIVVSQSCGFSSKDYSSSDSEKSPKINKEKNPTEEENAQKPTPKDESAADRLNRLLASMKTDENLTALKQVSMAKPGGGKKKRDHVAKSATPDVNKDVFEAAKRVATLLGEDNKQQTESELLSKLLHHGNNNGAAAATTSDGGNIKKTNENDLSLSDLIIGMKIDRRQQTKNQSRGDYVRNALASSSSQWKQQQYQSKDDNYNNQLRNRRKFVAESHTGSVNLFGCTPLGIFKDPSKLQESTDLLSTWEYLQTRELKLQVAHPPTNYFQKMALWTEQGKLWKFPIDNEQGMDEEAAVDFTEHVFLEQHLEPWCPTKGPIRHFMELVCVGLSKNPYITANEKKEHIFWYRDYFNQKKDILKELMNVEKLTTKDAATTAVQK